MCRILLNVFPEIDFGLSVDPGFKDRARPVLLSVKKLARGKGKLLPLLHPAKKFPGNGRKLQQSRIPQAVKDLLGNPAGLQDFLVLQQTKVLRHAGLTDAHGLFQLLHRQFPFSQEMDDHQADGVSQHLETARRPFQAFSHIFVIHNIQI
jgi:hypothetical protein